MVRDSEGPSEEGKTDGSEASAGPLPSAMLPRLHERIAEIAVGARHPEEALRAAIEEACNATGWPIGHVWVREEPAGALTTSRIWHVPEYGRFEAFRTATEQMRFEPGQDLPGRVLVTGEPASVRDVAADPEFQRAEAAAAVGVRAAFAVPVPVNGETAAVLEFFSPQDAAPEEGVVGAISRFGAYLGRILERLRAEETLRGSEARLRALADNARDAIVTIDDADRMVFVNAAAERLFGYSREEMLRLPFTTLIPERYRQPHRAGIRRYVATGERRLSWDGVELPGLHREGHEVPLEISFGHYVRGGRHFFSGIMRDITERKQAERERDQLFERERQSRGEAERRAREETALRHATEAVSATVGIEAVIQRIAENALTATNADGAFFERLDAERGQVEVIAVAGERIPALGARGDYRGSYTEAVVTRGRPKLLESAAQAESSLPEEITRTCGDCVILIVPLRIPGGAIGALFLIRESEKWSFRPDEVERASTFGKLAALAYHKVQLLEDSEAKREELERMIESRGRLLRGFSHDVRNSLATADGFLDLLEEGIFGNMEQKQAQSVGRARRALRAALELIGDLVDLARAEAGQIQIHPEPVDVRELAADVVEEYRAAADAKGLVLEYRPTADLPLVQTDGTRVRQILGNLVSNAVKYTHEGRVDVSIAPVRPTEGEQREPYLIVQVADTGKGIPDEKRDLVFQEFTRLDPEAAEGAGLGLAISKRIARAMGGDLMLESEVGKGSTFTLWLPIRPAQAPQEFASSATGD